jgi:branched-chain amino acid transport system ATP-binding protein
MSAPLLEVVDLHAYYSKSHILHGVNLRVGQGEIVSLLGRNGVGRSTTIKAIMGAVPPIGSIRFKGDEIAGLKPHETARRGLGYVPETRDIFPALTVRQNLMLGEKSGRAGAVGRCRTCFACSRNWKPARIRRAACSRGANSRC